MQLLRPAKTYKHGKYQKPVQQFQPLLLHLLAYYYISPPPPTKKNTPTHIRSETADQQPLQSLHLPRSVRPERHLWYINGQNPAHQLMGSSSIFIVICMAFGQDFVHQQHGHMAHDLSLGGWFISTLHSFVRLRYQSEFAQKKSLLQR